MTGYDSDTWICESASIPFGVVVSKGTGVRGCVKGGTLYAGVSIRDITLVHTTADQYELTDNVGVAIKGDLWVRVEAAVVARTAVKYNTTTGALGSAAGTTIAGAIWMTSAGAAGMAVVRLDTASDVTT
jgi:hypothetical protein